MFVIYTFPARFRFCTLPTCCQLSFLLVSLHVKITNVVLNQLFWILFITLQERLQQVLIFYPQRHAVFMMFSYFTTTCTDVFFLLISGNIQRCSEVCEVAVWFESVRLWLYAWNSYLGVELIQLNRSLDVRSCFS